MKRALGDFIVEVGTNDGTSGVDNIMALARRSNMNAKSVYGPAFNQFVISNHEQLNEKDLLLANTDGQNFPMLKSGFNNYNLLSNLPMKIRREVSPRIDAACLLVVPEVSRVLSDHEPICGLPSALNDVTAVKRLSIVDGLSSIPALTSKIDAVRAYDSHLSTVSYWCIVRDLLTRLGVGNLCVELGFWSYEYRADLGCRIVDAPAIGIFGSEQHMIFDEPYDVGRNRGTIRRFVNKSAPLDAQILVLGDSHSLTGIGQMLSFFFQRVHFYWMGRMSNDSPHWGAVERLAPDCDFVIEQTAERFFLANFCETSPA